MPLKRDPNGGGTEADGSLSLHYCSICYQDGAFVHANTTAVEFQKQCLDALKRKGMPHLMAWLFTRGIPNLPRWKSA